MPEGDGPSILVVCAHPDDECLGAGGAIAVHANAGIPVDVLCLTGNDTRNRELKAAAHVLGVRHVYCSSRDDFDVDMSLAREVVDAILRSRPKIVITHSPIDYNRAHVTCSSLVDAAVEWASHVTLYPDAHRVKRVYHMEINSLHSRPQVMLDISAVYGRVVEALRKHVSQMDKAEGYYLKFYDARTALRGIQSGCDRAEAFRIVLPEHAGPFYPENATSRLV
ncbi:MAG: PIG-L deacetylase family protein [Candidatus Thorarchaeota archaeon]